MSCWIRGGEIASRKRPDRQATEGEHLILVEVPSLIWLLGKGIQGRDWRRQVAEFTLDDMLAPPSSRANASCYQTRASLERGWRSDWGKLEKDG